MTKQADLKQRVRARMAKTGESYAVARIHVLGDRPQPPAQRLHVTNGDATVPGLRGGELAGWGDPGPGRHVTIWANAVHVYLQIDDRFWGTSATNYRHGPGWHAARPPRGFTPRHPPGL